MLSDDPSANADLICFGELFLAPFFPNRLEADFDRYFLHLPDSRISPIFLTAKAREPAYGSAITDGLIWVSAIAPQTQSLEQGVAAPNFGTHRDAGSAQLDVTETAQRFRRYKG